MLAVGDGDLASGQHDQTISCVVYIETSSQIVFGMLSLCLISSFFTRSKLGVLLG